MPVNVACGSRFKGLACGNERRESWQDLRSVVSVELRLVQRRRVLIPPVHADRDFGEERRAEGVEQGADEADRLAFERAHHLGPPGGRAERRRGTRALVVAELKPAVRGRRRTDVPVHAHHLIVSWPVRHGLVGVVVLIAARRVGRIRRREQAQERLCRCDRCGGRGFCYPRNTPVRQSGCCTCPRAAGRG